PCVPAGSGKSRAAAAPTAVPGKPPPIVGSSHAGVPRREGLGSRPSPRPDLGSPVATDSVAARREALLLAHRQLGPRSGSSSANILGGRLNLSFVGPVGSACMAVDPGVPYLTL